MSDMMNYLLLFESEDSGGGGSGGGAMQTIDLVIANNVTTAEPVFAYNIYDESLSADTMTYTGLVFGESITAKAIAGSYVIVQYSSGSDVTVLYDEVDVTDDAAMFVSGDGVSAVEVATVSFNPSAPRPSQITITVSDPAIS